MRLPSVFANKIDKDLKNNTDYYRGDVHKKRDLQDLKLLFDNNGYANRINVILTLKSGDKINTKLVLCKRNCFVTLNNQQILFDEIIDYEIKK